MMAIRVLGDKDTRRRAPKDSRRAEKFGDLAADMDEPQ